MGFGLLASLMSAFLAASKDLVSKRLASGIGGTTSTYASFAYALPYYILLLVVLVPLGIESVTFSTTFLTLVVLRATTDALAEGLKMHAFAHGDISLVATFFSISPLFLLFTSPLITGDPLSIPEAIAVVLVVVGSVVLVARPTSRGWREQERAIVLAVSAAFFFSLNSCFDRLAVQKGLDEVQKSTPVYAGFAMTLLSALFLAPFVIFSADRRAELREYRTGLWVRGFLEVAFMSCKLTAVQYLTAPNVAAIQRLSLLPSILGGRFLFKEQDFGRRLAAAALILVGVTLAIYYPQIIALFPLDEP